MTSIRAAAIGILLAQTATNTSQPQRVSMVRLLSTPEQYNKTHVLVIGYISIRGNEDKALFLHCDDLQNGNIGNSLRLDRSAELPAGTKNGSLVGVEGMFILDKNAVGRIWNPGWLSPIDRIEPWPLASRVACSR